MREALFACVRETHTMKNVIAAILLAVLAIAPASAAADESRFTPLNGHAVIDDAGVIPDDQESALNRRLKAFSDETGRQMAIVTIESLEGENLEQFTGDYARFLRIGSKELEDGVVYLVAVRDRKQRLEVGSGLGGELTDIEARRIQELSKPHFRAGEYAEGIGAVTDAVLAKITPLTAEQKADKEKRAKQRRIERHTSVEGFLSWLGIAIGSAGVAGSGWYVTTIPRRRRERRQKAFRELLAEASRNPESALTVLGDSAARDRYREAWDETALRRAILGANGRLIARIDNPTSEERAIALRRSPSMVFEMANATEQDLIMAMGADGMLLERAKDASPAVVAAALVSNGNAIRFVAEPTNEQILEALRCRASALQYVPDPTEEQILVALKGDGTLLQLVDKPSAEVRLTAVRSHPRIITTIADPRHEEISAALSEDISTLAYCAQFIGDVSMAQLIRARPEAIQYLREPSAALQKIAVAANPSTIALIVTSTDEAQEIAIGRDSELARKVRNPSRHTRAVIAQLDEAERKRQARMAEEARQKDEEDWLRMAAAAVEASARRNTGGGGFIGDSGSFTGGGGSFDGGGASSDW